MELSSTAFTLHAQGSGFTTRGAGNCTDAQACFLRTFKAEAQIYKCGTRLSYIKVLSQKNKGPRGYMLSGSPYHRGIWKKQTLLRQVLAGP